MILARHKEAILFYSECGKVYELCLMNGHKTKFNEIFNNCSKIEFLCLLNPEKTYGIILDYFNCLMIINLYDGSIVANFQINKDDKGNHNNIHLYVCMYIFKSSVLVIN
jgi:hypothetical protein